MRRRAGARHLPTCPEEGRRSARPLSRLTLPSMRSLAQAAISPDTTCLLSATPSSSAQSRVSTASSSFPALTMASASALHKVPARPVGAEHPRHGGVAPPGGSRPPAAEQPPPAPRWSPWTLPGQPHSRHVRCSSRARAAQQGVCGAACAGLLPVGEGAARDAQPHHQSIHLQYRVQVPRLLVSHEQRAKRLGSQRVPLISHHLCVWVCVCVWGGVSA
jgi:hypothetical protein